MSGFEDIRNGADWQARLYDRYHQKVFGICLYFLKDREEAKDAAQDVFLKAFRAWKGFEWKCDPMTWLGAIARHDCFSRRMRQKRHLERRAELAFEESIEADAAEGGEDLVLHRLRLEKILPEVRGRLREILRLAMEGLNHREIANRIGVSRVAITRRLTRFRKELAAMGIEREAASVRVTPSAGSAVRRAPISARGPQRRLASPAIPVRNAAPVLDVAESSYASGARLIAA